MIDPLNCVLLLQLMSDPFIETNSARMALDLMAMRMDIGQTIVLDKPVQHNEIDLVGIINGDAKLYGYSLFAYWEGDKLIIDRYK